MNLWNYVSRSRVLRIHVVAEICMPHAMQIRRKGGPEVLNWTAVDVGEPGSGQVRLRQAAAGLNYILEGAGTVKAIAPDVRGLKVGDRVAYAGPHRGRSFCAQGCC
jgi:NADPH:quinone reductase-like Zn-dependent oxidoreductase